MQGRLELRKPQNLTGTRQYGKTHRVEFTLTKLEEDFQEQKLETNYSGSQNFKQKQWKKNTWNLGHNQPGRSTGQGSVKAA